MPAKLNARLIGVELYFSEVQQGRQFYGDTLGLDLLDEEAGRYARFGAEKSFVCVERKGSEPYPSRDKAVIFLEVPNLEDALDSIGREKIVAQNTTGESRGRWAVLHDPEDYNVLILEAPSIEARTSRQ